MKLVDKIKKAIADMGLQLAREMNLTLAPGSERKRAQMELGLSIFHGALCCYAGFLGALDQFVKAETAYNEIRCVFSDTLTLLKNVLALDIMHEEAKICSENRGFTVSEVQKTAMPVRGEILAPMLKANLEPSISCLQKAKGMLQNAVDLLARLKAGQDLADQAQTDKSLPVAAPEGLEYVVERARDMNLLGDKKEPLPEENCFSYNGKSYLHLDQHHFYESTGYECFLTAKAASTKSKKLEKAWRKYWRGGAEASASDYGCLSESLAENMLNLIGADLKTDADKDAAGYGWRKTAIKDAEDIDTMVENYKKTLGEAQEDQKAAITQQYESDMDQKVESFLTRLDKVTKFVPTAAERRKCVKCSAPPEADSGLGLVYCRKDNCNKFRVFTRIMMPSGQPGPREERLA